MGKIMTMLSLYHILHYSRHYVEGGERPISVVEFNKPGQEVKSLLGTAISDLNQGAFEGYRKGNLQFGNCPSLDELRSMDDQESWLRGAVERAKASVTPDGRGKGGSCYENGLWFRIYDGEDSSKAWTWFYFNENPDYGSARLGIDRGSSEFREDRVKGIVSPFVGKRQLDEVVKEIMAKKE